MSTEYRISFVLLVSAPLELRVVFKGTFYSRVPGIRTRAFSINFSSLSCVLYSRARSIRDAHSNQGNTVCSLFFVEQLNFFRKPYSV